MEVNRVCGLRAPQRISWPSLGCLVRAVVGGVARAVLGGSGLHSVRLGVEEILRPFEVRIIDLFGCGEVGGSGRSEWQCGHTDASGEAGDPLVCVRMAYPHTVGVVGVLADLMPHVPVRMSLRSGES
jgi:hypothetical protein